MYIKQGTTTKIVPVPPLFTTSYQYKYNGKELQEELGLNVYDYGNRFYDPATGRWYTIDQMAEKFYDKSGYNYALNNPVIFIDPDGNEVEMCCDGLKNYLSKVWNGATSRASSYITTESLISMAYPLESLMHSITTDPVGTAKGLIKTAYDASPTGIVDNAINNPEALGATFTDGAVAIIAHKVGNVVGKTSNTLVASAEVSETNTVSNYSNLTDSKSVGAGKPFTSSQKSNIISENMKKNGGVIKSDFSGKTLDKAVQSKSGVKANMNQAEVDHIDPKSKGGTNSYSNAQVLSKTENLKKSNN